MTTVKPFSTIFTSVQQTVKTSSGSAVNIVICLVTVGSEQLFSFAAFNCPCPASVNQSNSHGFVIQPNRIYGWVFIIVPALALFILGYAMNQKTWKLTTGCCRRSKKAARGYMAGCQTLMEIFVQALVAPAAWASIAFLDGKYYACAMSANPFTHPCEEVLEKGFVEKTSEYEKKRRESQIIGWVLIAVVLFVGSVFYMIHRCSSPLTYHHRRYARWYRELEDEAFEKHAKEQIKAEVEKETVKRFLQRKRGKDNWDKIATVFTFIRDKKKFALYSRLDQWNEEHKKEELLADGEPLTNELDLLSADESSLDPPSSKHSVTKAESETSGNMHATDLNTESESKPLLSNSNKNDDQRRASAESMIRLPVNSAQRAILSGQRESYELQQIPKSVLPKQTPGNLPNGKLKTGNGCDMSPSSC